MAPEIASIPTHPRRAQTRAPVGLLVSKNMSPGEVSITPVRRCRRCRRSLEPEAFHGTSKSCSECNAGRREKYRREVDRHRLYVHRQNLKQYGLTVEDYDNLLAGQGGTCALCERTDSGRNRDGSPRKLHVDHDHNTEVVRALLCPRCNSLVGWLEKSKDDPELVERALRYLGQVLPVR